jgi:hypothetical protein
MAKRWRDQPRVTSFLVMAVGGIALVGCSGSGSATRGDAANRELPGVLADESVCYVGAGLRTYDAKSDPPGKVHDTAWMLLEAPDRGHDMSENALVIGDRGPEDWIHAEWRVVGSDSLTVRETRLFPSITYHLVRRGNVLSGEAVLVSDLRDRATGENRVTRRPVSLIRGTCPASISIRDG